MTAVSEAVLDQINRGKALLASGKPHDALPIFLDVAGGSEASDWAHFHVGQCHLNLRAFDLAQYHMRVATRTLSNYFIEAELARCFLMKGDNDALFKTLNHHVRNDRFMNLSFNYAFGASDFYRGVEFWLRHRSVLEGVVPRHNNWHAMMLNHATLLERIAKRSPDCKLTFSHLYPYFLSIASPIFIEELFTASMEKRVHVQGTSWDLPRRLDLKQIHGSVYDGLPGWVVERLAAGTSRLVLDSSEEAPIIGADHLEKFWRGVAGAASEPQVAVLTANSILPPKRGAVSVLEYNVYPILVAQPHTSGDAALPAPAYGETETHRFSLFNGMPRPHRALLMVLLEREGLLPCVNYSWWNKGNRKNQSGLAAYLNVGLTRCPGLEVTPQEVEWLKDLPDRVVELPTADNSSHHACSNIPFSFMNSAAFHIVSETEFLEAGKLRMTEKTFKPVLAGRPFLMVGVPGVMQYLEDRKFDLLSDYVDHSYDDEKNPELRLRMIVKEIGRLRDVEAPAARLRSMRQTNIEMVRRWTEHAVQDYTGNLASWLGFSRADSDSRSVWRRWARRS